MGRKENWTNITLKDVSKDDQNERSEEEKDIDRAIQIDWREEMGTLSRDACNHESWQPWKTSIDLGKRKRRDIERNNEHMGPSERKARHFFVMTMMEKTEGRFDFSSNAASFFPIGWHIEYLCLRYSGG